MATKHPRTTSQKDSRSVIGNVPQRQGRPAESSSTLPRDSSGALPTRDDREAVTSMRAYMPPKLRNLILGTERGLFYPSTVRTKLLAGLRASWHGVWVYYCPFKGDTGPMLYAAWLSELMTFLQKETYWAGLLEVSLKDLNVHLFLTPRKGVDPIALFAEMMWRTFEHDLKFTAEDYSKKQGPAYYLRDVRYPCFRVGVTMVDHL